MGTHKNKGRVVAAALLSVSLASSGNAQASAPKAASPVTQAAVPMPKSDRIQMAEFKKLQARNDVVTIDVRSSDAYAAGHIPGALSIPEETITPALAEKLKRMGKPIALYCS
jgi:3-mercaptopyruvate sulfurtransferase SseA